MIQTNLNYDFNIPTRVMFGAGKLNELHNQQLPGKKALLVISNGKSTRVNGYLDRTVKELEKAGVASVVFDKVQANPLKSTAEEGAMFARENNCDFAVALGGGSVIDCTKAICLNATNPGDLWNYVFSGTGKRMWQRIILCLSLPSPQQRAQVRRLIVPVSSAIPKPMKRLVLATPDFLQQ